MPGYTEPADREMRQRILGVIAGIDQKVSKRHLKEFTVLRSYARKDARTHCNFVDEAGPHRSDPMTVIRIEIEVPDDVTPELRRLVVDITEVERLGVLEAKRAALQRAKDVAAKAQVVVEALEKELS